MYVSYIIRVFSSSLCLSAVFFYCLPSRRDVLHSEIVNQINNLFRSYMEDVALFLKNEFIPGRPQETRCLDGSRDNFKRSGRSVAKNK